jgi:hypothetical protein
MCFRIFLCVAPHRPPKEKAPDYSTIHRFEPVFIQGAKEVSFRQDQALNDRDHLLESDKENGEQRGWLKTDTFTQKARRALEMYKSASSSQSASLNVGEKVKRHAPLPFQMSQS